jgi:hypothetical protein
MRIAGALVLAGCAGTPVLPALSNHSYEPAIPAETRSIDIPIVASRWRTDGSARFQGGALTLDFCRVAWGGAFTDTPELAVGRWSFEIDHTNTDCSYGAHALVAERSEQTELATIELSAGVVAESMGADIELATSSRLVVKILAGGNRSCCGRTSISSIHIERME